MNPEEFFDTELAPRLREITEMCKEKGMPFLGQVEYEPGRFGLDGYTSDNNPAIRILYYAAMCGGNVDKLILNLIEDGKKFGHNSIFLKTLETE